MELWITVLLWSLVGSAISLCAGIFLLTKKLSLHIVQLIAVPFAAGSLLSASFLDLLPEAFSHSDSGLIPMAALGGFILFFILERSLSWFHHHHEDSEKTHIHPTISLLVLGDTLHNFVDGLVIGAAFLVDTSTGIVVTLAIAAHEVPQEVGDFGLMLALGVRRRNVLLMNLISALATVLAALGVLALGGVLEGVEPYLLAIAAGFFIYVAASDIIPVIHAEPHAKTANIQTAILIVGIVAIGALITAAHGYVEPDHATKDSSVSYSANVY